MFGNGLVYSSSVQFSLVQFGLVRFGLVWFHKVATDNRLMLLPMPPNRMRRPILISGHISSLLFSLAKIIKMKIK